MAGPPVRDPEFARMARSSAGAALGAIVAGLPVLWGQIGPPVVLSAGLALLWVVIVAVCLIRWKRRALVLLLGAPFAWLWTAVAIWLTR